MEVALRTSLEANEAITVFELSGRLNVSAAEAAKEAVEIVASAALDCRLYYVASGTSKKSGLPVSTVPGLLDEVQSKADNQLVQGAEVTLYCLGPNRDGAPKMSQRRHRSLSAVNVVHRAYTTLTRAESVKTFSRRVSLCTDSPSSPLAVTQDLKGLSQLTLTSRQSTSASASGVVSPPISAPLVKATDSFASAINSSNCGPQSAPPVVAKASDVATPTPVVVKVEVKTPKSVSPPVVTKTAPPSAVAVVNLVEDSPMKPIASSHVALEDEEEEDAMPAVKEEKDLLLAPTVVVTKQEVKTEEVNAEVKVEVNVDEEEDAMPTMSTTTTTTTTPEESKKPKGAFGLLMSAQKKGNVPAKAASKKAASTKIPKTSTAKSSSKRKKTIDEEEGGNKSESEDEEEKEKAQELRRYQEEQSAPIVLSTVNDELELGSFMPLAPPVQSTVSPAANTKPSPQPAAEDTNGGPSPGVKRPRDVVEKDAVVVAAPAHKNILSFFNAGRHEFSKQWEKKSELKIEKLEAGGWATKDVVMYHHHETKESIDVDEYKKREADFVPTPTVAVADGSSPGAARRANSGSAGSVTEGAAGAADDEDEPPKKKARTEATKRVNKKEAPAGQRSIASFFAKK